MMSLAKNTVQQEAANEQTPRERLRQILASAPPVPVLRALAQNPNTPTDGLWDLAVKLPREVLANPLLPLLHLENSDIGSTIPEAAVLGFLCLDDLPSWMLDSFARGPLSRSERVKAALEQHWQLSGEAGSNWKDSVQVAISEMTREYVARLSRNWGFIESGSLERALRYGLVPDWLAAPLAEALNLALKIPTGVTSSPAIPLPPAPQSAGSLRTLQEQISSHTETVPSEKTAASGGSAARYAQHLFKLLRQAQQTAIYEHNRAFAPKLSEAELEHYAADQHLFAAEGRAVRVMIARHPKAPHSLLERLANNEDAWVRGALARNERLTTGLLARLAGDEHCIVRANVARHPNTSVAVLQKLADDEDGEVLDALLHRHDLPLELAEMVARRRKEVVAWGSSRPPVQMARDPQTPTEVLEALVLANEANETVRRRVASNRKTPAATLRRLATDPKYQVRAAVAANPAAPAEVLQQLSQDTFDVRRQLASNPSAPLDILLRLMDEDKPLPNSFHHELATNVALPPSAVERLWSQVAAQFENDAMAQLWDVAAQSQRPVRSRPHPFFLAQQKEKLFGAFLNHPNTTLAPADQGGAGEWGGTREGPGCAR